MIEGSCHCGAIRLKLSVGPKHVIDCNCSICRRYGALWATFESDAVAISGQLEALRAYVWGRRTIRTMHCAICGCVTHWEPTDAQDAPKIGINMRNFDISSMAGIGVRRFDGADSWEYLD
jgi:hypothetical protein